MAKILLGVSGGIAAYKALELIRLASAAGHSLRAIQTPTSTRFVGEASFAALTGAPVLLDEFAEDHTGGAFPGETPPSHQPISHLQLAARADLYLIAPASANTLAKLAGGLADNLLTSCALAATCPLVVAPAMNNHMYEHPATQANLDALRTRGVHVIEPDSGRLASLGEQGVGRLAAPERLLATCEEILAQRVTRAPARGESPAPHAHASHPETENRKRGDQHDDSSWHGLRVLVTAGGTREPIDSVRFVGNSSSGLMGLALAAAARRRGADVVLVAANVALDTPPGVTVRSVCTAAELKDACEREFPTCDVLLMAAAVADYAPAATGEKRPKGSESWQVELHPTADVVRTLAERRDNGQVIVAFGAELGQAGLDRKRAMLADKNVDLVVYNDVGRSDIGFDAKDNEVVLITRDGETRIAKAPKARIAVAVLDEAVTLLGNGH
ncbi:MAG: bifunctional phosphopantothenoylcysteine decarboxylase/phosphopantothenate synthase [Solirubrobacteraceae bacterium]